jgi:hypothetical protein
MSFVRTANLFAHPVDDAKQRWLWLWHGYPPLTDLQELLMVQSTIQNPLVNRTEYYCNHKSRTPQEARLLPGRIVLLVDHHAFGMMAWET